MEKRYAILKNSNGAFAVVGEYTNLDKAKVGYHDACKIHWNASDVKKATIMLCDEEFNLVEGYKETITHEVEPTVQPTEE